VNSWKVSLAGLLLTLLGACGGGGQPAELPAIKSASAERDVVDGAAKLTSTIQVQFDRTVKLAPSKVPLASQFELSVPDIRGGAAKRVLVSQAAIAESNSRLVVLHVDALVPQGTELRVARRAFQEGAEGDITAAIEADLTPETALLASVALGLTRAALLSPQEPPALSPGDRDPQAMRQALEALLEKQAPSAAARQAALARYDSISSEIVPSPKLRAALAALTGTFAEPAIDYLLTSNNCTGKPAALIAFQPPPDDPKLLARATFTRDGRRVISLNPTTEGNRIEHLMPLLVHEAIHCDNDDGRFEEVAATAMDTWFYLNLVANEPELVDAKSPLARELNVDAIAMINSGRRLPESVGILKSPGVSRAIPETTSAATSFADVVAASYAQIQQNESAEEPLAQKYVEALAQVAGMKPGGAFNLVYLDEVLGRAIEPRVLVAAINALGLVPVSS
jgi:hypothetical protein